MYSLRSPSIHTAKIYSETCCRFRNSVFTSKYNDRRSLHFISNSTVNSLSPKSCVMPNYRFKTNNHTRCISTSSRFDAEQGSPSLIQNIAESDFVYKIQDVLVKFHDVTGLSWWATVIVAALTVRTVFILPIAIHQHYITAKLETVHDALNTVVKKDVTKEINDLSHKNHWDSKTMSREYKKMMQMRRHELILKYNCHPAKTSIIVLIQAPVWISLSSALRNFTNMIPARDAQAEIVFLEMKASGFLWLSDLTIADKSLTIPICLALVNLSTIQINYLARKQNKGMGKFFLYLLRIVTLVVAYISSTVPSLISLYWLTSSGYGLCQNLILLTPRVRQFFGIPITKSMQKHPFKHISKRIKGIVYFFKY